MDTASPRRELTRVRIRTPLSMILIVPIDPTGELPPGDPVIGFLRCRCRMCVITRAIRWIGVGADLLRRLLIPGPEQTTALRKLTARYPWARSEQGMSPDDPGSIELCNVGSSGPPAGLPLAA